MANDEVAAPVVFQTVNKLTIAQFTCKEITTLDVIDVLLEEFKKKIEEMKTRDLLIDFSGVTFVATSAINMLLVILKRIRMKGGDTYLCGIEDNVGQIFELMQINRLFDIYSTQAEALVKVEKKN